MGNATAVHAVSRLGRARGHFSRVVGRGSPGNFLSGILFSTLRLLLVCIALLAQLRLSLLQPPSAMEWHPPPRRASPQRAASRSPSPGSQRSGMLPTLYCNSDIALTSPRHLRRPQHCACSEKQTAHAIRYPRTT